MSVTRLRGIIRDVSIRRTIESLLGDEQQQEAFRASPEAFFADHGIEDIPGELIGTAFVHYSDTAPIEHGDAVAGIATHYSPVPFESDDLPGLDLAEGDSGDPFATLGHLPDGDMGGDPADGLGIDEEAASHTAQDQPVDDTNDAETMTADDADTLSDAGADSAATDSTATDSAIDESNDDSLSADLGDDVDSASFHDRQFDDGFDDGFDEAEALENGGNSGFGEGVGQSSAAGILGEIHGEAPLDPETDDPFFEEVTDDAMAPVHVDFEPIDFEEADLGHSLDGAIGSDLGHDGFVDHAVDAYEDVDPGDLDHDDF